jgi:hypothetical protein
MIINIIFSEFPAQNLPGHAKFLGRLRRKSAVQGKKPAKNRLKTGLADPSD